MVKEPEEDKIKKIYDDLQYSVSKFYKLHKEIKKDFEFVQGKQWDDSAIDELRAAGVKALTINKIKPIIKLLTGIERQSKSDFIAMPEGEEDGVKSDIASRLIKNVVKTSTAEEKLSEQFKHGCIGGLSYIEPYIDYSNDIINGEMNFKKVSAQNVFPDPDGQEYDMSDHRFVIKLTTDLTQDDLLVLFPDEEKTIKEIQNGKVDLETVKAVTSVKETFGYPKTGDSWGNENPEETYDLLDYYYKKLVDKYYVADPERGMVEEVESKEKAEEIASQIPTIKIIKKKVPAIYLCQVVGDKVLYEGQSWTYPAWHNYPLIPFYSEFITEDLGDKCLNIQGVVRSIRDLQDEFNKRRTQELRHLNASANSGFDVEEGQLSPEQEAKLKKFGSSPGVLIKRSKGSPPLVRISPMPLSQGHAQLAEENSQDLKEASGVNPDLLANDSQSQSGRAILLKQRQGLVMVQEMIDNFGRTKKLVGQFILSQLKEVFTVESAQKVLGETFITEAFQVPVTAILDRASKKIMAGEKTTPFEDETMLQYPQNSSDQPAVDPMTNQLVMAVDVDAMQQTINDVLTNSTIGKYDISIGEGPFNETIKMSNFMEISDLAKQGIPIPPETLIELSGIPAVDKKKIIQKLQEQQMLMAQQAQAQKAPSGTNTEVA